MNINLCEADDHFWFEDSNGNKISDDSMKMWKNTHKPSDPLYYKHSFVLEVHECVDTYCYHPKNSIVKWLCKKSKFLFNVIGKNKSRTFKPLIETTTSYGSKWSQECIVAMVNSGDYTLEQAVWVYTHSCERCMNVLLYKYLNGKDGYQEYSEEWEKCNTECRFCKKEVQHE